MEKIENLNSPPVIGETYIVPCVLGKDPVRKNCAAQWWPVFRPKHEDTEYTKRAIQEKWSGGEFFNIDEVFYGEQDPYHYHVDPRFAPTELYSQWEVENESWHNFVYPENDDVEFREMKCIREMPPQRLFTGFTRKFVEDHQVKEVKCGRCPHKGTLLNSMPMDEGKITCPAHGLKFDCLTGKCVTN